MIADEPDNLCMDCGFCCDGTLFGYFVLTQGEDSAPLLAHGVRLLPEQKERVAAAQPCGAFRSGRCAVYTDRPAVCRNYRCDLLEDLGNGVLSLTEARGVVAKGRALRDAALSCVAQTRGLPVGLSVVEAAQAADIAALGANAETRRANAGLLMAWAALQVYLERHFQKRENTAGGVVATAAANDPLPMG
jgi:hypothetical protein